MWKGDAREPNDVKDHDEGEDECECDERRPMQNVMHRERNRQGWRWQE